MTQNIALAEKTVPELMSVLNSLSIEEIECILFPKLSYSSMEEINSCLLSILENFKIRNAPESSIYFVKEILQKEWGSLMDEVTLAY